MKKCVYIVSTLDTKREEVFYVKALIEQQNIYVKVVDLSTKLYEVKHHIDVGAATVATYHPKGQDAVFCGDRGKAIEAMAEAFALYLQDQEDVAGIIGLGGSGGTALITPALQKLSIGTPKIMVSTMASGDISGYIGASDISMMYSVTDISGLNVIARKILKTAAHQMAGAVLFASSSVNDSDKHLPAIGLSMFGVTTPCVQMITEALSNEYDCIVFHATGSGGKAMEKLTDDQMFSAVLDITTTEVCDHLFEGVLACDEDRFGGIKRSQTPAILSCGALDMVNFGKPESVPSKYAGRLLYHHNPYVTLMRTTPEENRVMAKWIAAKLNQCEGEVVFVIPEAGFSALDAKDMPFWDPAANDAFISTFKAHYKVTDQRRLVTSKHHINSPEFVKEVLSLYHGLV